MPSFSRRLSEWLVCWRWPLLMLAAAAAGASYFPSQRLGFDRSIENMFAADDPLLVPYRKLKQTFGGNEIVLVVYRDEQLLAADGAGLARLSKITSELRKVAGVRDVLSLSVVNDALERMQSPGRVLNIFRPQEDTTPAILDPDDELAAKFRELFVDYTHSADGKVAAIACMLVPESETDVPRRQTVEELRRIAEDPREHPPGMIAGEPVMIVDGFRYLEQDGDRLGLWSTLLLGLTLVVCFRSLRWVLIPIAVVSLTLLLTQAILVVSGLRLSMVSSMLRAIVTVVGVATVVHIIVRFREARFAGWTPRGALVQSGRLLMWPVIGACATDAVGFGSLLVATVGPVQDFGVMMAVGSLVVLLSVALLVPGLALILGRVDADPHRAWGEGLIERQLGNLIHTVERAPKTLAVVSLVVVVAVAAGVTRLDVETDFTNNFRSDSPIVTSYQFIERHLGGAGVWDVIVPAPKPLTDEYLERVRKLERRLREITVDDGTKAGPRRALTKVISLADVDEVAKSGATGLLGPEARAQGMAIVMKDFSAALRSTKPDAQGHYYLRIMLRARERQPAEQKERLIAKVESIAREEFPAKGDRPAAEVTGFFVLMTNLIHSIVRDQWVTFGVAASGIGLMLLAAFRSLKLALIALVPNALPIVMVLGALGWLDLKINMGAAMIAAVSMGLSVDSSIHYLTSFRRAQREGKTVSQALAEVQQTVGRAMVFSTLALIVGFSVLCISQFVPTIYFGALVSISMLGGLVGNLLVLPLLLKMFVRDRSPSGKTA